MNTTAEKRKEIAVFGATGQQGGSVVRALQARGKFNGDFSASVRDGI